MLDKYCSSKALCEERQALGNGGVASQRLKWMVSAGTREWVLVRKEHWVHSSGDLCALHKDQQIYLVCQFYTKLKSSSAFLWFRGQGVL